MGTYACTVEDLAQWAPFLARVEEAARAPLCLDRGGSRGPASAVTWDSLISSLRRYVGFAKKVGEYAWESARLLYDGPALVAYMLFMMNERCALAADTCTAMGCAG